MDLDSPRWEQLQQAYGSASDIPDLLRQLPLAPFKPTDYRTEPWFSLWNALCHQGSVYSASYAAVPHLVAFAALRPPRERWDFILLVSSIEVCRHHSTAPALAVELAFDYTAAVEQMRRLVWECLECRVDSEDDVKVFLSALAVFNGFPSLGNAIVELPEPNSCPNCAADVLPFGYELP